MVGAAADTLRARFEGRGSAASASAAAAAATLEPMQGVHVALGLAHLVAVREAARRIQPGPER